MVVSILLLAEFGRNDHRKDAPHLISSHNVQTLKKMQLNIFTIFWFVVRSYASLSSYEPMNHDENMLQKPGSMLRLVSNKIIVVEHNQFDSYLDNVIFSTF